MNDTFLGSVSVHCENLSNSMVEIFGEKFVVPSPEGDAVFEPINVHYGQEVFVADH